ncbi:hypothetical protein FRC01_005666, partial [Tulasnella sp. 417]
EGWSAVFDSEMFSEFDIQCLKQYLSNEPIQLYFNGEKYQLFRDQEIRLVDLRTDAETSFESERTINSAWSGDNRYCARLTNQGFQVWDPSLGEVVFVAQFPPNQPWVPGSYIIDISGDGKTLALNPRPPGLIYTWGIPSETARELNIPKILSPMAIYLSFDGRYVALQDNKMGMHVYRTESAQLVGHVPGVISIRPRVRWFKTQQKMAVEMGYWVKVWDIEASEVMQIIGQGNGQDSSEISCVMSYWHSELVVDIQLWPGDDFMATICRNGRVTLWDLHRTDFCFVFTGQTWYPNSLCATILPPENHDIALTLRLGSNIWRIRLKKKDGGTKRPMEGILVETPVN